MLDVTPPQHSLTPHKTPPNENKRFQLWQLIFAKFNMSYGCLKFTLADQVADLPPSQSSIDALNTITLHVALPSQLNTDALHTTTPTAWSRTMHVYIEGRWTPLIWAQMPCILLHPLLDLGQYIYIEGRWTPPIIGTQMPCILLHPLLDLRQCIYIEGRWTPQSFKHRCLTYCYTHC